MKRLKIITKPNAKQIAEAIELDNMFFNKDDSGILSTCVSWNNKNSSIYLMLQDTRKNKIVGYINTLPITDKAYEYYKTKQLSDIMIDASDVIKYSKNQEITLLFMSIVILREYRTVANKNMMLTALFKKIYKLAKRNIFIRRVLFDCVTKVGEYYMRINFNSTLVWRTDNRALYESVFSADKIIDNKYKKALKKNMI